MRDLTLVLIELGRIEGGVALEGQGRGLPRIVRDLEIANRRSAKRGQAAGVGQNVRDIAKPAVLAGVIVDGIARGGGIFHSEVILKIAARREIVESAA